MARCRWHHTNPPENLTFKEWPHLVVGWCAHLFAYLPIHYLYKCTRRYAQNQNCWRGSMPNSVSVLNSWHFLTRKKITGCCMRLTYFVTGIDCFEGHNAFNPYRRIELKWFENGVTTFIVANTAF
eukprot:scaffold70964_cov19-Prasinocladus_malaysianus.AAC.1